MAGAKPELRPSGIASGLRLLGGRSKLAGLDKFLLGMPANLRVSLNIYRGISIQLRCREKRIEAEDSPHIRDLFHQKYRGSRYSFGYPACPNLEDQTKLFALLKRGGECRSAADQRIFARARAVNVGDHGPPPGGEVFRGVRKSVFARRQSLRNPLVPQPARAPRDFPSTTRFPSPSPRAARTI